MPDRWYNWRRTWFFQPEKPDNSNSTPAVELQQNEYSTDDLASLQTAALIAEPGLGKTQEIGRLESSFLHPHRIDLATISTWPELKDKLQDALNTSVENPKTVVLLDGLDEMLAIAPTAGTALGHFLKEKLGQSILSLDQYASLLSQHPETEAILHGYVVQQESQVVVDYGRLSDSPPKFSQLHEATKTVLEEHLLARSIQLFITCRTADWPQELEKSMRLLWRDNFKTLLLQPLNEEAIRKAAQEDGADPQQFIEWVKQTGTEAMAVRPITLRFMLDAYNSGNLVSLSQVEIYEIGCRQLCAEYNDHRIDSKLVSGLSSDQLLTVAKRIAALMVLGGRTALQLSEVGVNISGLSIAETIGGSDGSGAQRVEVNRHAVEDAARTALFRKGMNRQLHWSHRTYAEFLAACYLIDSGLSEKQWMTLLTQVDDPERHIAGPLREVAAWLAVMRPDFGKKLATQDPLSLINSAALPVDNEGKRLVVETLLEGEAHERIPYTSMNDAVFRRLKHPASAQQLRPWILNSSHSVRVRLISLHMVQAQELTTLWNDLFNLSLNPKEDEHIRDMAGRVAIELMPADELPKKLLKYLGKRSTDNLRGMALHRLWPDHLTATKLFKALVHPGNHGVLDSYKAFINYENPWRFLKDNDLPRLFNWLNDPRRGQWVMDTNPYVEVEWRGAQHAILARLWQSLDNPKILKAFAGLVREKVSSYRNFTIEVDERDVVQSDEEKRRRLAAFYVKENPSKLTPFHLLYAQNSLLQPSDYGWILDQYNLAKGKQRSYWLKCLVWLSNDPEMQKIFSESGIPRGVKNEIGKHKKKYEEQILPSIAEYKKEEEKRLKRIAAHPKYTEEIEKALSETRNGNLQAWITIPHLLYINDYDHAVPDYLGLDILALNGWIKLECSVQDEIIAFAKKYLLQAKSIEDQGSKWGELSTVRALRALSEINPDFVTELLPTTWRKWLPALFTWYPLNGDGKEVDHWLWEQAYRKVPDEFRRAFTSQLDLEKTEAWQCAPLMRQVEPHVDEAMGRHLLKWVKENAGLKPEVFANVMQPVLKAQTTGARPYLEEILGTHSTQLDLAVQAAALLVAQEGDASWPLINEVLQINKAFGEQFIGLLGGLGRYAHLPPLSEIHLAQLYEWAEKLYPAHNDPVHPPGVVWVSSQRDGITNWRNSLLNELKTRGTIDAVREMERLSSTLVENKFQIRRAHADSVEQWLYKHWIPTQPEYILKMTASRKATLVRDADDLLNVVMEAIEAWQGELQGENYTAPQLWNITGGKQAKAWPKDEESISDHLTAFLTRQLTPKGIVLNREVQIRRRQGAGGAKGERTDVRVDALRNAGEYLGPEKVSLIIEVKGAWNGELETGLENQLTARYLADNKVRHGIYVVAWPVCPQWNEKKKKLPEYNINEAEFHFAEQADEISSKYGAAVKSVVVNTALR